MSAVPKIYLTPAEYLRFERQSDVKHEYFRGELFAIPRRSRLRDCVAGASRQHARIAANLAYLFVGQLKGRSCDVFGGDMRVKVSPTGLVHLS